MKILIIRSYPSFINIKKNTYNIQEIGLAKALVRKGNVCDIIFWTDHEENEIEVPVDKCGKIHIFYKRGITVLKNTVYTGCDRLFENYDILQTAEYNQIQSWILAGKYRNKVIIYHGPYFSPFNRRYNLMCYFFDKIFLKRYIKLGSRFLTKSVLAERFLEDKGINKNNIITTGVGIDVQMLVSEAGECREKLYSKMKMDKSFKLLYIGHFEKRRNIPFIFDVLSLLLKKNNKITLYMIGSGSDKYLKKCWEYADKLNIRDNIIYESKIEQNKLSLIYGLADFFILPSEYEIFGMVLLEAMYNKTVVLTTNNGGSSTLINDKNGIVLNEMDAYKWADKIIELIKNRVILNNIKENAHETIKNSYTWDKLVDMFIFEYQKLLFNKTES